MLTEKWSQKERDAAKHQLWPFGDPSKWRNYSLGPSDALDVKCQNNILREALERLRPLIWEDIKRGHGLFSDKDLEVTDAALGKSK